MGSHQVARLYGTYNWIIVTQFSRQVYPFSVENESEHHDLLGPEKVSAAKSANMRFSVSEVGSVT